MTTATASHYHVLGVSQDLEFLQDEMHTKSKHLVNNTGSHIGFFVAFKLVLCDSASAEAWVRVAI